MPESPRIPLTVKLLYTVFMAVLVPVYWYWYGPANFLYFCDIALFLTLVGVWRESRLLIGVAATGIVMPQLLWCVDFGARLFTGSSPFGMTEYMFEDSSLFLRGLSLFHGWLPFFLLWLVARIGYDRRAWCGWLVLSWAAMAIGYFCMPRYKDPDNPLLPYNINYVFGLDESGTQPWLPEWAWFAAMLVAVPVVMAGPAHVVLKKWRG